MTKTLYYEPRAKRRNPARRLGNASTEAPQRGWNGWSFLQGGNQVQTFVLLIIMAITLLFVLSKVSDAMRNKKESKQPDNAKTPDQPRIITPDAPTRTGAVETPQTNNTKTLQHLLQLAGYYTGLIDGHWGGLSDQAMRAFEDANGITRRFTESNYGSGIAPIIAAIPVVRQILKNNGTLQGTQRVIFPATAKELSRPKPVIV